VTPESVVAPEAVAEPEVAVTPESVVVPEPVAEPESLVAPEPAAEPEPAGIRVADARHAAPCDPAAALAAALDSLGQAHHRPFSRS
jgi:hypothetical protein